MDPWPVNTHFPFCQACSSAGQRWGCYYVLLLQRRKPRQRLQQPACSNTHGWTPTPLLCAGCPISPLHHLGEDPSSRPGPFPTNPGLALLLVALLCVGLALDLRWWHRSKPGPRPSGCQRHCRRLAGSELEAAAYQHSWEEDACFWGGGCLERSIDGGLAV